MRLAKLITLSELLQVSNEAVEQESRHLEVLSSPQSRLHLYTSHYFQVVIRQPVLQE